ncbi:hypothetical protein AKJ09_04215 [Labilithrix luteola]|uniref:Uncharacterized protein n=2 Tax=Labilithrix luteola TaxID=1391654 RepID=A0A0K1PVY5_9BACT|nr:hypothetical protein AKJ09_04215 [Labilithrix luteola]
MLVGCSGGSLVEFRPAKNAKEFPATKAAYRVNEPPFCDSIGVIHADGPHPIEEISELAAAHGGTHYIVRSDRSKEHYETTGFITSGLLVAQTEKVVDRHVWVQVFRCDS